MEEGGGSGPGPGAPELCKRLRWGDSEDEEVDWTQLPEEILLHIFQYLPLLDRAFASQVCRGWNQAFHMPELWRCFEFELNQPASSYLKATHPDLIKQIIKRHSNHLQYVSFKVRSQTQVLCHCGSIRGTRVLDVCVCVCVQVDSSTESAEAACDILSQLVNCSLKTLGLISTARPSFMELPKVRLSLTHTHSDRQTLRQTDTQTDRHTDRQTDTHRDTETDRQTDTHTQTDRPTDRQTDRRTHTDTHTHTHTQTDRHIHPQRQTQTDRQTHRQTHRQTDTHTDRHTHRPTDRHTHRPTDRQTDRQAHTHTDRQTDTHTDRHTDRQTHTQTDRQTHTDTDRHTQTDRQTDTLTHTHSQCSEWSSPSLRSRSRISCCFVSSVSLHLGADGGVRELEVSVVPEDRRHAGGRPVAQSAGG